MITFPHAKINLCLRVTGRRTAGFHNIETIMYPVGLSDALEVVVTEEKCRGYSQAPLPDGSFSTSGIHVPEDGSFSTSGIHVPEDGHPNICIRAYKALQLHLAGSGRALPPVRTHLHKCIPVGAGLGGGSADAAFMLMLLNKMFTLGLTTDELRTIAASLGSDCSFFIQDGASGESTPGVKSGPQPMLAIGRGEILEPVSIPSLQGYHLVLVTPPIHVSTVGAYAQIVPSPAKTPFQEIIASPVESWPDLLINDFEAVTFHPTIRKLRDTLYDIGATYASMSGSGASVFGVFEKEPNADIHNMFPGCLVWQQSL